MSKIATHVIDESLDPVEALTVQQIITAANEGGVLFTSAEKAKLAAIEEAATADQTDAQIVAAIDAELGQTDWKSQLTTEELQDAVAAMLQAGTHTNLTVTYDDGAGTISLAATGGGGGLDQEEAEDIVAALVDVVGGGINVAYDDAAGTLTFSLTGESYTTAEKNKLAAIPALGALAELDTVGSTEIDDNAVTSAKLATALSDKLDVFTVTTDTIAVDRGLLLALYDEDIAAGETDAPPPGAIFRSSNDGKTYQRMADGSDELLNNAASEYGAGGSGYDGPPVMVDFVDRVVGVTTWPEVQAGDVVIMYIIANATMTLPAGWTRLHYEAWTGSSMEVAAITADGTESGNMPDDNEAGRWVFVIRGATLANIDVDSVTIDGSSVSSVYYPYIVAAKPQISLMMGFSYATGGNVFVHDNEPTTHIAGTFTNNDMVYDRCASLGNLAPSAYMSWSGFTPAGSMVTLAIYS